MMSINNLTEDFKTLAELKNNLAEILNLLHRTGRPIVVTVDGKPDVVIMDVAAYEQQLHNMNLARMLAEAEAEVREGKARPLEDFLRELEDEKVSCPNHARSRK